MKKTTFALAALAAVAFTGTQANAQSALPLSFEVRGGAAIPTGDWADLASTGFGLNGNVTFNVTPVVGIYGGYTWNRFGINDDLGEEGDDVNLTEQGFDVGLKARFASPTGLPVTPFFRGGAIFHKIAIDEDFVDPGEDNETDMKLGFEVGGGVEVGLSRNITLTPQVGYSQFNPSDEDDADADDINVSNITASVGINIRL